MRFAVHEKVGVESDLEHVVRALALIDDLLEQILVGEAGVEFLLGESVARELEQMVERLLVPPPPSSAASGT